MTCIVGTFSFPIEKKVMMDEFKKIADREGINQSRLLVSIVEEYVKKHSDGNPSFTIDQFQDPGFQAVPAYFSKKEKWINNYKNSNEKDKTKLRMQAMDMLKWFRMVDVNE